MNNNPTLKDQDIELKPSYTLPLIVILGGLSIILWQKLFSITLVLFGVFLLIQARLIKLKFTTISLEVYRGKNKIRDFPYQEWQNWKIFWQPFPILFYFKEVKSIHFLPIIFEPDILKYCLEKYLPCR